jgi:hypothetical protein
MLIAIIWVPNLTNPNHPNPKCAHSIARHKKSSEDPVTGTFPNQVIDQIVILFLDLSAHLPLGMYCNKFPVLTWCVVYGFACDVAFARSRARVQLSLQAFLFSASV